MQITKYAQIRFAFFNLFYLIQNTAYKGIDLILFSNPKVLLEICQKNYNLSMVKRKNNNKISYINSNYYD